MAHGRPCILHDGPGPREENARRDGPKMWGGPWNSGFGISVEIASGLLATLVSESWLGCRASNGTRQPRPFIPESFCVGRAIKLSMVSRVAAVRGKHVTKGDGVQIGTFRRSSSDGSQHVKTCHESTCQMPPTNPNVQLGQAITMADRTKMHNSLKPGKQK